MTSLSSVRAIIFSLPRFFRALLLAPSSFGAFYLMPTFFRLFALALFLFPVRMDAQGSDANSSKSASFLDDVHDVFRGIGYIYSTPLRWGTDDWILGGGLVTLAGGAFLLDDEFRHFALKNQSSFGDRLNSVGNFYGQSRYVLAFAVGTYAVGFVVDDPWIRGTGVVLLQTLISAGALNLALKALVGRSRPYENNGNTDFHPWAWEERFFSFPSGHTVMAFSVSSVLAARIKNIWATIGLYSFAGVTAWSRVYSDDHWFSDVVIGGIFTTAMGLSLVKWYEGERETSPSLSIIPMPFGCTLQLRL